MSEKKLSKTALNILQVSTQMFADHGYEGTIMDNLAEQAGVNKASIYYHFKDKEHLYEVCLTQQFQVLVDHVIADVEAVNDTTQKLTQLILSFAKKADEMPEVPSILMRELASGGVNMPVPAREQLQRILFKLKEILDRGVNEGVFNAIDPFSTHIMIIGSICFFVTSKPMRDAIKASTQLDPKLEEAMGSVADIILNGMLKSPIKTGNKI
ncbi:MAG: TetR/AcrR family transcriptional regulator [Gammaproteobacteria bacterium]|nr:TetR/AcrR family transcriptional regulator [Gammaproteobacteria bacterium]